MPTLVSGSTHHGRSASCEGKCDDDTDAMEAFSENVDMLGLSLHPKCAQELLVVFDMDHTMVGDLFSLSDRDNVETNMPWEWWPDGVERGLGPAAIIPYLQRGMMRPGLPELLSHLRHIGATIVVYTHSEDAWAVKVCQALESVAGWPFIFRLYSRSDCRDGHPEFRARKSLQFICDDLRAHEPSCQWVDVRKTIMFDDDGAAVVGRERDRLVTVASYDHWAPCPWDENVNESMLAKNPDNLAHIVRASVVAWGIAPPSYANLQSGETLQLTATDLEWEAKQKKKEAMMLAFNEEAKLDRVLFDVLDAMADTSDLDRLPAMVRGHLSTKVPPRSRRASKGEVSTVTSGPSCSQMGSTTVSTAPASSCGHANSLAKSPMRKTCTSHSPAKAQGPGVSQPTPGTASGPEELPPTSWSSSPGTPTSGGKTPARETCRRHSSSNRAARLNGSDSVDPGLPIAKTPSQEKGRRQHAGVDAQHERVRAVMQQHSAVIRHSSQSTTLAGSGASLSS